MSPVKEFGGVATSLSRGPLGIIALFIVLVYGFAALVLTFGNGLQSAERLPFVYFLVIFPVLVLLIFTWLVSVHNAKLYPPSDFRDDSTFLELQRLQQRQLSAAASLAVASVQSEPAQPTEESVASAVAAVSNANPSLAAMPSYRSILWVDDNPSNNTHTRRAFEAVGIRVVNALSTAEALDRLAHDRFDAVISDMKRKEGPQEGYALLEQMRQQGISTPFFIHAGSATQDQRDEARRRGARGNTANPSELFEMVMKSLG